MNSINWASFPPPRLPNVTNAHDGPRRLYLAGPMSGVEELNYPAFNRVAAVLRHSGFVVLNPAETDLGETGTWESYMRLGITQVVASDGLALMDGYGSSRGARIEMRVAQEVGLPTHPWARWIEKSTP